MASRRTVQTIPRDRPEQPLSEAAAALAGELRLVTSALRRQMREAQPSGLKGAQLLALMRLSREGPLTVTALARAEGIRPQSMGFNVAGLEQAGLVSRTADPQDGRQTLLSLTPAARALIQRSRAGREDWLAHAIEDHFTREEQDQVAEVLKLLRKLVDESSL